MSSGSGGGGHDGDVDVEVWMPTKKQQARPGNVLHVGSIPGSHGRQCSSTGCCGCFHTGLSRTVRMDRQNMNRGVNEVVDAAPD